MGEIVDLWTERRRRRPHQLRAATMELPSRSPEMAFLLAIFSTMKPRRRRAVHASLFRATMALPRDVSITQAYNLAASVLRSTKVSPDGWR